MTIITVTVALLVLGRLAVVVVKFARLTPAARCHYLPALWARFRWRWLAHNLQLAYIDRHRKSARRLPAFIPFGTSVKVAPVGLGEPARLRFPRARFRPDDYGIVARIRTVPKVGRAEFETAAPYLADAWRCHRVSVAQPRPGRLVVRGLRRDPLAEPFSMADVPAGVYGGDFSSVSGVGRQVSADLVGKIPQRPVSDVYLGRDEWGSDRWIQLANITAAVVGGLPGTGKTTLANSLLCQLAPSRAVRLVIADGQGGADFHAWRHRAYAYAGDDRAEGAELFEDAHGEMRLRYATVLERTGHRNAWRAGPAEDFPLYFLVVDEANVYLDETMAKGDRQAEAHVRTCRAMLGQLVRRGRSVMVFTLIISHKPTTDSVPSFISANAGLRLCFGVQTVDAAVSVLGATVREYPAVSPVELQGPESVGVLTARLATGSSPFTRLRVPEVTEEAADQRAAETARMLAERQETVALTVPG
jgi:S-DNA-T family DNA segregation ATPase FtsK/SpoIIIE